MSKNVLEISVRSDIGGGPKHLLDLLTYNSSETKLFVAIPYGYDLSEAIRSAAEDSIEIPHRKFSIVSLYKLIRFCKKNKIKTVHSHGRGAGYYSRLMKLFGFKVIHTLHGVHIEDTFTNKVKFFFDRLLKNLTDQFICVSSGEMKSAIEQKIIRESKTNVIVNGVEVYPFRESSKKITKICMLGRLCYQKGYDLLIEHIEAFCKQYPKTDFTITIAGHGEDEESLKYQLSKTSFAKDKIIFQGKTLNPIAFLSEYDGFLSMARFEGLPLSLLEAISLSLPCIVSNVVGNADVIQGDNGLLFELENQESFNKSFLSFTTQSQNQKAITAHGHLKKHFDIKLQVISTVKLYYY